jgi:hypothetical protein
MEDHERLRTVESLLELQRSDPGVLAVVSPRGVRQCENGVADARVGNDLAVGRLLVEDPPLRRLRPLVRHVVPGALLGIAEHTVRLDDPAERVGVPAVTIVWVVALREVAKHALDGVPIGPRRYLKDFVEVSELSCRHRSTNGLGKTGIP